MFGWIDSYINYSLPGIHKVGTESWRDFRKRESIQRRRHPGQ